MSDEEKPQTTATPIVLDRDFEMFKDYCAGMSAINIAKKYDIDRTTVYQVASRDKWKPKKRKLVEDEYKQFKEQRKAYIKKLSKIMLSEVELIAKLQKENPNQTLHKDTISFVHKFYETLSKQVDIDEGKPTEITTGTHVVRHEVVIPQGAKWGVLPPISDVTMIEKTPEDQKKDSEDEEQDF